MQTYYLTLDLSHSGMFEKVKDAFHAQNRGGYRQWYNPVYADPNKNTRLRPTKTNAMLFAEDKDDDEEEEDLVPREDDENEDQDAPQQGRKANGDAEDQDSDNPIDPALRNMAQRTASGAPSRAPSRAPSVVPGKDQHKPARLKNLGEVQILDLHSDNPIVSYKGRIFSGTWASNIGTELMLGSHDEIAERNLPYLRLLPEGVDLMAASSVRILTTPADLRLKNRGDGPAVLPHQSRRPGPDRFRSLRKEAGIEIPVAFDKHGRRKPQARFLENLMAIKRSRGEMDEVTTMTRDTTRDFVDRAVDPEEASAQKKRARDRLRQQRLMEEKLSRPPKKRKRGNRWMRRRVVSFADRERGGSGDMEGEPKGDDGVLSRTTPKTWKELDGDAGDGGGETGVEGRYGHGAEDTAAMTLD